MRATTPKVWLIARPAIDFDNLKGYLESIGGAAWLDRVLEENPINDEHSLVDGEGELLIEAAGRGCYRSWDVGLNPNVTKVRTDSAQYLENILRSQHGSVLAHAHYSFIFQDVSRIFTHELVRHAAGSDFSQESLRFVRLDDIPFEHPEVLMENPRVRDAANDLLLRMEEFQVLAAKEFALDEPGLDFHTKKTVTSAMRRYAPEGVATMITWTVNVRALRHVIASRTDPGAEDEIRRVFDQVAQIMVPELPNLLGDFQRHEDGSWKPAYPKV